MKRTINAFVITLLIYTLIVLGFYYTAAFDLKPRVEKEEKRVKIELKNFKKKVVKKSGEKRELKIKKSVVVPLMPKGEQLKKIEKKFTKYIPPKEFKKIKNSIPKVPKKKKSLVKKEVKQLKQVSMKKTFIPLQQKEAKVIQKLDTNKSKKNVKNSALYSILSQKVISKKSLEKRRLSSQRESKINADIDELYGDEFGKLSEGEQKYILDNQEVMRRITQEVLNRVGAVNIPQNLRVNRHNLVEFYLYPNGDISDIEFIDKTGFYILDDTTKETIEYAYAKYPRPKQKTLIRYKIGYYLRGY